MATDHVVRPYKPGDEDQIIQLLDVVFDGWPHFNIPCTPLEHWEWKYLDNPRKKYFASVAEVDGRIVGCCHSIPVRIKIGELGEVRRVTPEYESCRAIADRTGLPLLHVVQEIEAQIRSSEWMETGE